MAEIEKDAAAVEHPLCGEEVPSKHPMGVWDGSESDRLVTDLTVAPLARSPSASSPPLPHH